MNTTAIHSHPALTAAALGRLELTNRLAVAPMSRVSAAPDGTPTGEMTDYYAQFARGGFGIVITEGTYTDTTHSQGYLNQPGLATDDHVDGWRRITDAVHATGTPVIAQLMHAGALSQGNPHAAGAIGPSAIAPIGQMLEEYGGAGSWPVPREMTPADIDSAGAGYTEAAARARAAGFDGVEVHAANGYLLDQFLTVYTNVRADEYGGAVHNRIRLTARVIAEIRSRVGDDFVVGCGCRKPRSTT
jgi:2,4-dienoyl-CoA reductase-like NADH-dependent reductase (Old Yellow Enzyme family)